MKIKISRRAALARFNRYGAKQGQILRILRTPIHGSHHYVIVDKGTNSVVASTDYAGFIGWLKEDGLLKAYEEVES